MLMLIYFFKAWVIGIAIAAPVGPIGMLCIRKTLELGMRGALIVGLGAALADGVYGMIAALGLTTISYVMIGYSMMFKLMGGVFLLYLAYKEARSKTSDKAADVHSKSSVRIVGEIFFLTITNPMTILSFIGIFASIGPISSIIESFTMVIGIFLGSMTWWCVLGFIIIKIKHRLPRIWLERTKWVSCVILVSFGVISLFNSFD